MNKSQPAPEVPGNNPAERFDNALRMVLAVPKDALLKEELRRKKSRAKQKLRKKAQAVVKG